VVGARRGECRVQYTIDEGNDAVTVTDIGQRRDAYR
jgi:mRNA-degrading endonuclease RelE of RelBE toxin-antitoxin system